MIRSNSFALFGGENASGRAEEATSRVRRFCDRVLVDAGDGFIERPERGKTGALRRDSRRVMVSLSVGEENDRSLPLVHGFLSGRAVAGGDGLPSGEFALVGATGGDSNDDDDEQEDGGDEEDHLLLARDVLGTRPLFFDGRDFASDHRFLPRGGRLLDPGELYHHPFLRDGSTTIGMKTTKKKKKRELLLVPRAKGQSSLREASEQLSDLLVNAVRECVAGHRRVGVSFSGGLDSAILALVASRFSDVTLFSVHTEGSLDETVCQQAAELLDLELKTSTVGEGEVATEVRTLDLPFVPSQMDRALWCIYSIAARSARQNGSEVLLLGQLADELFGGYLKYSEELEEKGEEAAAQMMRSDVLACSSRAFVRDEAACGTWIEPRFPFANEELVAFGLGIPVRYKISAGEGTIKRRRKVILRDAASRLGLPERLTQSPKKAAQYSSGVLKQVGRLPLL